MDKCKLTFIAWSKLSTRTRNLAHHLGAELFFIQDRFPYISAWIKTGQLTKLKPDVVIIQLPQGPLLYRVLGLAKKHGFRVVTDVHTGFLISDSVKSLILNAPFRRLLRKTNLVVLHNENLVMIAKRYGLGDDKTIVVYDPPPRLLELEPIEYLTHKKIILVPASWANDEPLDYIVREYVASSICEDYMLVITGNPSRNRKLYLNIKKYLRNDNKCSRNIVLTGFISDNQYMWLLQSSSIVITVTRREYTLLSSLWESIYHNKPALVSKTKTLSSLLGNNYPCFFTMSPNSLRRMLEKCLREAKISSHIINLYEELRRKAQNSLNTFVEKLKSLCPS